MTARLFGIGWLFHLKSLTNSLFFVLVSVLQPVIFASIAFFMVESGSQTGTLLYVALGAGPDGHLVGDALRLRAARSSGSAGRARSS